MSALTAICADAVTFRRRLHRRPELLYAVHETAAAVRGELDRLGIPWRACAETGTVADLASGAAGRRIALRADLDALPLDECTGLPWASEKPGLMHACGHDGHAATLLGVAAILKSIESNRVWDLRPQLPEALSSLQVDAAQRLRPCPTGTETATRYTLALSHCQLCKCVPAAAMAGSREWFGKSQIWLPGETFRNNIP